MDTLTKRALCLYALRTKHRGPIFDMIPPSGLESLKDELVKLENYEQIKTISLLEENYPIALKSLKAPPPILFFKGTIPNSPMLAIVGTRKAEIQAKAFTRELSCEIARAGNTIVSGLALGIDGAAHEGALSGGTLGSTIAILGSGIKNIYPKIHSKLAEKIIEHGGGVITTYEPTMPPLPHFFLERNQLIAALSLGVLIVQAAKRSGSIATANAALELGKEVFACPGSVYNYLYEGSNKLLKAGATMVLDASDIFETLPSLAQQSNNSKKNTHSYSDDEKRVLVSLSERGPLHLNHLVEILKLPLISATSIISDLEVGGVIELDALDTVHLVKRI